jgi:Zn finger protein HypA/HybF involved in hydrogenase expression
MKEYLCLDCEMTHTDKNSHECPHCNSHNIEEIPEDGYESILDEDGFYEGDMSSWK